MREREIEKEREREETDRDRVRERERERIVLTNSRVSDCKCGVCLIAVKPHNKWTHQSQYLNALAFCRRILKMLHCFLAQLGRGAHCPTYKHTRAPLGCCREKERQREKERERERER